MQFNQTSSPYNGIIQTIEFLLDFNSGDISGNSTLLAQITNILNNDAYAEVISEILKNEGSWIWDDFNEGNSKFPVATQTLTDSVGNYALPNGASNSGSASSDASSFLRLIKAEVKDSNGYFKTLVPIDESQFDQPLDTVFATAGLPVYYDLVGASIVLYPSPSSSVVTLSNGLRITFQRSQVHFTVTGNDTQMPGFPDIYHYLLALITAETYAGIKNMKQLPFITGKKLRFMANLGWGVANRNKDLPQRITPRNRTSYE